MFESLTGKLSKVFEGWRRYGTLTEADLDLGLRQVRIALIEADVALEVIRPFIEKIKTAAIGQEVHKSLSPDQMVIKIVHDALLETLGDPSEGLNLKTAPPAVILMAGLQGSGKTTASAKIAYFLKEKQGKKVLLASLDTSRPAAQEQLAILGERIDVASLPIVPEESPLIIADRALQAALRGGYDVLILDTAGRLHIDDKLMDELIALKKKTLPIETLLVTDALTGQDAARVAKIFHEYIGVTGLILSRIDGDSRGGAALSIRQVSGAPLKFLSAGEKPDTLELFHPERLVQRILGMGDMMGLIERAMEASDQADMQALQSRMMSGGFSLEDLAQQLRQMKKMGGMSAILNLLPGMGAMKDQIAKTANDKTVDRQLALISSMTKEERQDPKILNASRKRRIAKGAGQDVANLNRLLKRFRDMSDMMKEMKGMQGNKNKLRGGMGRLFRKR